MSLFDFAKETVDRMNQISSGGEFAKYYVERKMECYYQFHNGLITASQGINFFENVIKFWDAPDEYCKRKSGGDDYEYNFVLLIKNNKK